MHSRVPLLNFVIPLLLLLPVIGAHDIIPWFVYPFSVCIFVILFKSRLNILECRSEGTKTFLVFSSILTSFLLTSNMKPSATKNVVAREITALVKIESLYSRDDVTNKVTAQVLRTTSNLKPLRKKIVLLEKSNIRFYGNFYIKGILKSNTFGQLVIVVQQKVFCEAESCFWSHLSDYRKFFINSFYEKSYSKASTKSFIIAFLTGEKNFFMPENRALFKNTGTMHLFAVSGLHFGIFYVILKMLLKIFKFSRTQQYIVLNLSLLFYLGFVGGSPSAFRAFLMIFVLETSYLFRRKTIVLNALSLAFIISVCLEPSAIFSVGFQMSYTIVLVLVWCLKDENIVNSVFLPLKMASSAFKSSCAAFVGSFLILLGSFDQFVPISLVCNFIIVPFAIPIMIVCIAYIFFLFIGIDFYFIIDTVYLIIEILLQTFVLYSFEQNFFNAKINPYFYITLPLLIILFYDFEWSFVKKILFSTFVLFSIVLVST